jgi:hypothetical protein
MLQVGATGIEVKEKEKEFLGDLGANAKARFWTGSSISSAQLTASLSIQRMLVCHHFLGRAVFRFPIFRMGLFPHAPS